MSLTATISKDFSFSASHRLPHLPMDHPCSRLHGHNYVVRAELTGEVDPDTGFLLDYRAMDRFKVWIDAHLDHRDLNETLPVLTPGPTSELMAEHLGGVFCALVDLPRRVGLVSVSVSETPKTWATHTLVPWAEDPHTTDADRYRWGVQA